MEIRELKGPEPRRRFPWETSPKVLAEAERTAQSAMTDGFVQRLKAYAKSDARRGVYMSGGCLQLQRMQMREHVSPDRSGPKAQVMSVIQTALSEPDPKMQFLERMLEKLSGKCSAKIQVRQEGQAAEVRAPNGEIIASYNSLGSGWTDINTKAENKFLSGAAAVYSQAYKEARAELRAAAVPSDGAEETSVDLRV